jgi:hypothetical protein
MVYNEDTKQAHYRWRETHLEQYRAYVNKSAKKYYQENKEEAKLKSLGRYYLKKEMGIFLRILL